MRAGRLTNRIQIERNAVLVDDYGNARETWLPLLTCKAAAEISPRVLSSAWAIRRVKACWLSNLPSAVFKAVAASSKAWALEISPAWLSTLPSCLSSNCPGALIKPPLLLR